jgi:hypothetical protein
MYKQFKSDVITHRCTLKEERQCTYNVTMGRVRVTKVAVEKQQLSHILTVFAALVIQNGKSMRRIILPSVACSAVLYFSTLSHQW